MHMLYNDEPEEMLKVIHDDSTGSYAKIICSYMVKMQEIFIQVAAYFKALSFAIKIGYPKGTSRD